MRPTASKSGLLSECQYWARPEAKWNKSTSAAAERGTAFHSSIAHYVETGEVPAEDPEGLVAVAAKWVGNYGRELLEQEVAYAWDPLRDTAHEIGYGLRDYSAFPNHLCGTADLVAVNAKLGVAYVADWKTGDGTGAGPQLRTLALMVARTHGLEYVTVEALEVSSSGVRHVCTETLDAFALSAIAGELAEQLAKVDDAEPVPGPHCGEMYCPARVDCPATTAIVAQVIPAESLVRPGWGLTISSPDHARWLLDHARLVGKAVDDVKEAVKAYVPKAGLELSDGSLLVEGTRQMPRTDHARVEMLARTLGATEEQLEACRVVVTESAGLRVKKPAKAKKAKAA